MNFTSADLRRAGLSHLLDEQPATPSLAIALVPDDGLNKTERAYAALLDRRKQEGEIRDYRTHAITFILGKDLRYTPDMMVIENDSTMTFIEIKGFLRDDALVKFRAAQRQFPWFRFIMIQRCKQDQGGWKVIRD